MQSYPEEVLSHIYEAMARIHADNPTLYDVKAAFGLYTAAACFVDGFWLAVSKDSPPQQEADDGCEREQIELTTLAIAKALQKRIQAYICQLNLPPGESYTERIGPWFIHARHNGLQWQAVKIGGFEAFESPVPVTPDPQE